MPSKPLDRATIREIIDLLTPFCGTPAQRRALFTTALGFHPVLNGLNYEDDAMTFIPNAIAQLHAYGEFEDGKTALWLVLEEVRGRVGRDRQRRIDALETAVNGGVQAQPTPQVVTPSVPPTANHERQIAMLLKQLEAAEAKQAWDIVIDLGEKILALDEWHEPTRDKTANAYYRRGSSYTYKIDHDRAIADLTRAIELNRFVPVYYLERGKANSWKGDYDRAIEDETRAIQLDPDKADYYKSRGASYYNKGEYDRAIADHTRAIQLDPDKAAYYRERGLSYYAKEDYDRAIEDKTRAIQLDPNNAAYYRERGLSYYAKEDYDRAIEDKTRALQLDPNNADYYKSRGVSYYKKGDYDCAIEDKTRAIQLDPNNAAYYRERGVSYHAKGDRDAARRDYQRAVDMGDVLTKILLDNL
jgi:tetratricopeptide (TPR) repeat protein